MSLEGKAMGNVHTPIFKNYFFAYYGSVELMNTELSCLSDLGDLGACSLGGSLKNSGARCVI